MQLNKKIIHKEDGFLFQNKLGIDFQIMIEDWEKVKSKVILNKKQHESATLSVPANSE